MTPVLSVFALLDVFLVSYDEYNDDYLNCVFFIPMKSAGYIENAVKRITGGDTFDAFAHSWNIFRIPATPFPGSSLSQ